MRHREGRWKLLEREEWKRGKKTGCGGRERKKEKRKRRWGERGEWLCQRQPRGTFN